MFKMPQKMVLYLFCGSHCLKVGLKHYFGKSLGTAKPTKQRYTMKTKEYHSLTLSMSTRQAGAQFANNTSNLLFFFLGGGLGFAKMNEAYLGFLLVNEHSNNDVLRGATKKHGEERLSESAIVPENLKSSFGICISIHHIIAQHVGYGHASTALNDQK